MFFWIVAGMLSTLVALVLARPLLAPPSRGGEGTPETAIYRDQLAEVDRDLARGLLNPEEAERARTEIARRLLAVDRAGRTVVVDTPRRAALAAAALAAVVLVMGSLILYSVLGRPGTPDQPRAERLAEAERLYAGRPSQAEAEAQAASLRTSRPPEPPEDVRATIEELRAAARSGDADPEGLAFLAYVEMRLGNAAEAARVQRQLVDAKANEATSEDEARLLDYMVAAADGIVTPEAEMVLQRLRDRRSDHPAALYYSGLLLAMTGRPDQAFPFWRALVEKTPPSDPYRQMAAESVEDLAWFAGRDYALPAASVPTEIDMAAAAELPPEEREAMIRGMVQSLSDRLAAEGGSAQDWARLITSLGVIGEKDRASAILAEARTTFADDPEAQRRLDAAARDAGLAE